MMMTETLKALVVVEDGADPALVDAAFPPGGRIAPSAFVEGVAEAERAIGDSSDLVLVACGGEAAGVTGLIGRARAERPDRPIVALAESAPDYFVRALLEAGADDVVKLPDTPDRVTFAIDKAVARHRGRMAEAQRAAAPMICLLGPKGGTGKTVTASNLLVGLARAGRRAVGVDLDLQFGDMGLALGLEPEWTIYDLATSGGGLDAGKLDAYLTSHESGARVLLAPTRPDQAAAISIDLLREIFALLRASYDVVVVDTPPDFTPEVIAAVDASSHVCVVGNMDSLSLKNTKLGLATLELMDYDPDRVTLILNRADSDVGLTPADVEAVTGRRAAVLVPSDRDVPRSLNEGVPIVLGRERSPVAAAMKQLAGIYLADGASPNGAGAAPAARRRWLGLRGAR
ncbi:MAG TPA: AAA family ATPase [Solirubrobacterales bacterium]|nr:AAA family ATPase [Solirubrobacterales bacterium]